MVGSCVTCLENAYLLKLDVVSDINYSYESLQIYSFVKSGSQLVGAIKSPLSVSASVYMKP